MFVVAFLVHPEHKMRNHYVNDPHDSWKSSKVYACKNNKKAFQLKDNRLFANRSREEIEGGPQVNKLEPSSPVNRQNDRLTDRQTWLKTWLPANYVCER